MELLCEKDLAQKMREEVWPTLSAARREVCVRAADGTELFAVLYTPPAPRGSVVLLHGLGETAEKYRELCYYFFKSSLTVLIFDQRGHGRSGRAVPQQLIWVDRFAH